MIWKKVRRIIGPSIITGASDDDPSGIATYTQAGAGMGMQLLWTAIATYPMMVSIQEMCARIGLVTRKGLTATLKTHYPPWVMWVMVLFSFPAIILNISANLAGMGAVGNLIAPQVPSAVFSVFFCILLIYGMVKFNYRKIATILQLLCLVLLCYLIVPMLTKPDWKTVIEGTFIPSFPTDAKGFAILVALLGTTISPYLFFWQTSMEVEEMDDRKITVTDHIVDRVRTDIRVGMLFSNLIYYFIVMTAGSVLFPAGIRDVATVDQAAAALKPLAGEGAYLLFAIGVFGTGLLAIPVLAGSVSYMISEVFGWREGLSKKLAEAKEFYFVLILSVLVAQGINLSNINPVKALIYTAILYGIVAPILIAIILHICNNRKIMGTFINKPRQNIYGGITLVLMSAAAIALFVLWGK